MTKNQRYQPVRVIPISDITDTTDDTRIQVLTTTGHLVWLTRSEVTFRPGHVLIPAWLFKKVEKYFTAPF